MSTYTRPASSLQEQAQLVREFQNKIKKLKESSNQLSSSRPNTEIISKISAEKASIMSLLKEVLNSFKTKPPQRDEKLQYDKLTKEFENLSKQFQLICQNLVEKQKNIIQLEEKHVSESDEQSQTNQTDLFRSVGGLDEALLGERHEELNQLEKDMITVNAMFKDVAVMVGDQGAMLDSAVDNIEVAEKETRKAVGELDKAEVYQRSAKKKVMLILIIVFVIVVALIGVVLATTGVL